ncbi:MAG: hypothetical protein RLZZ387_5347 [Chloroflexota bacterium]|jgi:uncharacterized protein YdhG (YjbR/CyaY superfamily)
MDEQRAAIASIDEYIASFPAAVQRQLQELRAAIRAAAPEAEEAISYQMPTFRLHGNLVHFAAYKGHIGFYPAPRGIAAFQERLSRYKGTKGSVQFPLDQALPLDLVAEIVRFRVAENTAAAERKEQQRRSVRPQRREVEGG